MNMDSAFPIFRLLETSGVGPARIRAVLDLAARKGSPLSDLAGDSQELHSVLTGAQIDAFRSNEVKAVEVWKKLEEQGVRAIAIGDERYPEPLLSLLGKQAPPLFFAQGNVALITGASVGFCGSRKASEKGLAVARECAEIVSHAAINVVSGYAAGVDMATHRAALEAGGTTTLVLAEGILHFRVKRDLKDIWDPARTLVISEYLPSVPWSVSNAMRRNQTICALCRAMVLIEAGATGGSIEAGRTCLKLGLPLFAPVYGGMPESAQGNRILLGEGARPLHKSRSANRANVRGILDVFRAEGASRAAANEPTYDSAFSPDAHHPLF